MSFDHGLGVISSSRTCGPPAPDERSDALHAPPASPEQATRWARRGLKAGLLIPLVAGAAMFAHPIAAVCADQTAAQRAWMYAIAAWVIAGGMFISAAAGMASRARRGERGAQRPVWAALGVGALATLLWAEPAPLVLFAIGELVAGPILLVLASLWVLTVAVQLRWPTPFSGGQLKRVTRVLSLEVLVWLPALFVIAALLDNVYHDCS